MYTLLYTRGIWFMINGREEGGSIDKVENIKIFIDRSFKDPVTGILLKYSNLTKIQFETLIIDLVSENISDIGITYKDKAILRSKKVSRGSFSRTLTQARGNIISAIYTILLLSYIGFFEEAPFEEYHHLSNKLKEYVKILQNSGRSQTRDVLIRIEIELVEGIRKLSEPSSLKFV